MASDLTVVRFALADTIKAGGVPCLRFKPSNVEPPVTFIGPPTQPDDVEETMDGWAWWDWPVTSLSSPTQDENQQDLDRLGGWGDGSVRAAVLADRTLGGCEGIGAVRIARTTGGEMQIGQLRYPAIATAVRMMIEMT